MKFCCTQCGRIHATWASQCDGCAAAVAVLYEDSSAEHRAQAVGRLKKFSEIPATQYPRIATGFDSLDTILGGGIVPGSVLLITGEPGAGKSTLMLQVLGALSLAGIKGAMIHAEESAEQLAARSIFWNIADRQFYMISEKRLEKAFAILEPLKPRVLLADSLQTVETASVREGSPLQVVQCCKLLASYAVRHHCTVIIVGHVTKDGEMSGPQTLKHLVDVTLHLEFSETREFKRDITTIKNRFGPSPYTLSLQMTAKGFSNE
jgi:DNA repair protein RadA/Sms